jgi:hypothetical protein
MAFVAAMSSSPLTKIGVKGSDVYTEEGVGDLRVAFFTQLVRGLSRDEIKSNVQRILDSGDQAQVRDLVVMAFHTRDVRGGKGERDLGRYMIAAICVARPTWAKFLIALVPEYGCWKDLWKLGEEVPALQKDIDEFLHQQFLLDQESETPSLLIKWLPREGTKYDTLAHHFANLFFPLTPSANGQRMRTYRRCLATLNRKLDTTEIKMCDSSLGDSLGGVGHWSEIRPKNVPGRLLKRCKNAFFNQTKNKRESVSSRYPDRQDRVVCAENFKGFMSKVASGEEKIKGGDTTMPHEHVHEIYHNRGLSSEALQVIQAQWDAIRSLAEAGGGLGRIVPMCDFSGSMGGVPKEVSLALGILISELASPAFKDHILTFDSEPSWHSFTGMTSLYDKVRSVGDLGQGLSTDFQKAADLILQRLVDHKVPREEAPTDLLVLTDMGFDSASQTGVYMYKTKPWQTHFDMIREAFQKHGYEAPRIVCWNLRAEYKDFHAKAHEEGVVQLSGWSPAVLKALQGDGIKVQTPYEGLRKILDVPRYDRVREMVDGL